MKFILIATFMAVGGQEPDQFAKITPSLVECTKAAQKSKKRPRWQSSLRCLFRDRGPIPSSITFPQIRRS
jgi:hypothetical protein